MSTSLPREALVRIRKLAQLAADLRRGEHFEITRLTMLLGGLGDTSEKCVGVGVSVRKGNAERAVVDVPVIEMFDKSRLVRGAKLGQVNLAVHEIFHGGTWGIFGFSRSFEKTGGPGCRFGGQTLLLLKPAPDLIRSAEIKSSKNRVDHGPAH
jgi:hypothetical protein